MKSARERTQHNESQIRIRSNPQNRIEYNTYMREYSRNKRMEVLDLLGRSCSRCGFTDIRALQIDHVNGGGTQEVKKLNRVAYYNKVLKSNGEGYQVLCANCNWIKRSENNETGLGMTTL